MNYQISLRIVKPFRTNVEVSGAVWRVDQEDEQPVRFIDLNVIEQDFLQNLVLIYETAKL